MTDNEITKEKTFSAELPHFKERIKEVFDNYNNPNGNEDPLYICVLRDSNRVVRKAEEEINRQQAENKRLEKEVNLVSIQFQDLQERYEESQAEVERLKEFIVETRRCDKEIKVEAYKECIEKVKNYIKTHCNPYGKPDFDYDTSIKILNFIDNLLKELEGEDNVY